VTGATPQGQGEQTQPMPLPPWPEVAGGWPSGPADRGPYADADTIDEPDAGIASRAGPATSGPAPSGTAPSGPAPSGPAPSGPERSGPAPFGPERSGSAPSGPVPSGSAPAGSAPAGTAGQGPVGGGSAGSGPGGPLLAWLWGEQGQAGEYLLASYSVAVGRDPGSDIVLIDKSVSREHARIEYRGGQWWLQPTDSAGPTWVNGEPVEPGQRVPVTDGDRIRFGYHTQFRLLVPNAR
jgi:FHA domain